MNRMSEATVPWFNKNIGYGLGILALLLIGGSVGYSVYFLSATTNWSNIKERTTPIFATTIAGTILIFNSIQWIFSELPPINMLLLLAVIASIGVGMSYSAFLLAIMTKAAP